MPPTTEDGRTTISDTQHYTALLNCRQRQANAATARYELARKRKPTNPHQLATLDAIYKWQRRLEALILSEWWV